MSIKKSAFSLTSSLLIATLAAQASLAATPVEEVVYGVKQWTQSLTQAVEAQANVIEDPAKGQGFHLGSDVYNWPQLKSAAVVDWKDSDAYVESVVFVFRRNKEGMNRQTTYPVIRAKVKDTLEGSGSHFETITSDSYQMVSAGGDWTRAEYTFPKKVKLEQLAICCYEDSNPKNFFTVYGNFDLVALEIRASNASGNYAVQPKIDTNIRRVNLFGGESPEIIDFWNTNSKQPG